MKKEQNQQKIYKNNAGTILFFIALLTIACIAFAVYGYTKNMLSATWIVILSLLAVACILFFALTIEYYNKFVKVSHKVDESLSSIDVHLKQRFDLIPNLVEIVKGYATHEQETFLKITELRAKQQATASTEETIQLANQALPLMNRLIAVKENYPNLKANQMFLKLQRELVACEGKIAAARRFYISNVNQYNTLAQSFPSNVVARMFGFRTKPLFTIDIRETNTPTV